VPQLLHIPGPETTRRGSYSLLPTPEGFVKSFRYLSAKPDSGWALPADDNYDSKSAAVAHSRSLAFLKPLLNGPYFDLEAVWEEHCKYEFVERDVAATMATMVERPYVNHIPTMTYVLYPP
jgi:carboxymethylenebutenolidase